MHVGGRGFEQQPWPFTGAAELANVSGQSMSSSLPAGQDTSASIIGARRWRALATEVFFPGLLGWITLLTCIAIPFVLYHATDVGILFRASLPRSGDIDSFFALVNYMTSYILPVGFLWGSRWFYYFAILDLGYSPSQRASAHDTLACWLTSFVLLAVGLTYPVRRYVSHSILGLALGETIGAVDLFFTCLLFCGMFCYSIAVGAILSDISQTVSLSSMLRSVSRWLLPASAIIEFAGIFVHHSFFTWVPAVVPGILLMWLFVLLFGRLQVESDQERWLFRAGLPVLFGGMMVGSCVFWGSTYNPFLGQIEKLALAARGESLPGVP
jgi:hypothetical protein